MRDGLEYEHYLVVPGECSWAYPDHQRAGLPVWIMHNRLDRSRFMYGVVHGLSLHAFASLELNH